MRTGEGTTIWYLRVIHQLAQQGDVWTLDISGEEWGEVDFPEDRRDGRAVSAGMRQALLHERGVKERAMTSRARRTSPAVAESRQQPESLLLASTASPRSTTAPRTGSCAFEPLRRMDLRPRYCPGGRPVRKAMAGFSETHWLRCHAYPMERTLARRIDDRLAPMCDAVVDMTHVVDVGRFRSNGGRNMLKRCKSDSCRRLTRRHCEARQ